MKEPRYFRLISFLTLFSLIVNILAALAVLQPAHALGNPINAYDSLSMMGQNEPAIHTLHWTDQGSTTIFFIFPSDFTGSLMPYGVGDCMADAPLILECFDGNTGSFTGLNNPALSGSYTVQTLNASDGTYGEFQVVIIDSDTVNVTSFVNTSLTFALHTGTFTSAVGGPANDGSGIGANTEMSDTCTAATCFSYTHFGPGTNTAPGNYTVDLGNLAAGTPNVSNTIVLHQDGGTGTINSIAFDLSANAAGGSTVSLASQNGALTRNGGAPDNWDIPSGSHGAGVGDVTTPIDFTALSGTAGNAYGFKFGMVPAYINLGTGGTDPATTMQNVSGCRASDGNYCTLTTAPQTILTTGDAVEGLKATIALGALANGVNPAGTYTDTLTFIATSTF